jgi:uncharacterized membrane protein
VGRLDTRLATMPGMLLAAEVWHYWIGVTLAIATVLSVIAVVVGYLVKVEAPQYKGKKQ